MAVMRAKLVIEGDPLPGKSIPQAPSQRSLQHPSMMNLFASRLRMLKNGTQPLRKILQDQRKKLCTAVSQPETYSGAMKVMHWATGGGILGCFATVQLAMNTKDKKAKGKYMNLHKSFGLCVAALVVPRFALRFTSKLPGHLPGSSLEHMAASASHGLFYVFMAVMPVTGIAMGYYGGKGLPFFGSKIPGIPKEQRNDNTKSIAKNSFKIHKQAGQYFEYLVPIHVGAAGFHAAKGQSIFKRIL